MPRWLNAQIALGFLIATVLWTGVLGWQAAYAPTEHEKQVCYEAAQKSGHKTEECKSLWERTTSDPVAFFTFWLVVSTVGLGVSTLMLWRAGEKQLAHLETASATQSRDMQASIGVARDATKAADRSAQVAERALILTDRPWIAVRVEMTGELIFDTDEIDAEIGITIKNVGKSPASYLTFHANLCIDLLDAAQKGREWVGAYQRRPPALFGYGRVLFPDEKFSTTTRVSVSRHDFLKRIAEADADAVKDGREPEGTDRPAVVVFVPYGLPNAGPTGRYRYTTFLGEIRLKNAAFGTYFDGKQNSFLPNGLEVVQSFISGEMT
jgi:hypothetical protein